MNSLESFGRAVEGDIKTYQQRASAQLNHCLTVDNILPCRLHKAMRYAVLQGGKRLRPLLVYLTGQTLNIPQSQLDAPACALELIHAYSLVHDDLPAMDDDDLRRGKPTCHKAFDEATAILVGDALQTLAFQTLSRAPKLSAKQRLNMIESLSIAAGSRGMVGGQALDMDAVGKQLNLVELENMHLHKTGALISASVQLAIHAAEKISPNQSQALLHYAHCIGLAFQIQDDVLDETSDTETLGKTQGADKALNKPTYPALLGLSEARERATNLVNDALSSLQDFDHKKTAPLRWLANYIIHRRF